jgi:hypothetical protein
MCPGFWEETAVVGFFFLVVVGTGSDLGNSEASGMVTQL